MLLNTFGWFIIGMLIIFLGFIMWLGKDKLGTAFGLGIFGVALAWGGSAFDQYIIDPAYSVLRGELATTYGYIAVGVLITFIIGCFLIIGNYIRYGNVWDTKANQGFGSKNARWRMVLSMTIILTLALPVGAGYYYNDYIENSEAGSVIYDLDSGLDAYPELTWKSGSTRYSWIETAVIDGTGAISAVVVDPDTAQPLEDDWINQTSQYYLFGAIPDSDLYADNNELMDAGWNHINWTFTADLLQNISEDLDYTVFFYDFSASELSAYDELLSGTWDTATNLTINYALTFEDRVYLSAHSSEIPVVCFEVSDPDDYFTENDVITYDIIYRESTTDLAKYSYTFNLVLLAIIGFSVIIYAMGSEIIELPSESEYTRKRGKRGRRKK